MKMKMKNAFNTGKINLKNVKKLKKFFSAIDKKIF